MRRRRGAAGFAAAVAAAIGALATPLLTPVAGLAADVFVEGCSITGPGQVGLDPISADIGDTVTVALTVHVSDGISDFGARINYPNHLLDYEGMSAGDLTSGFEVLDGRATGPNVRIGGFSWTTFVPAGATGSLALVSFVVIAGGVGEFGLLDLTDDIENYHTDCAGTVPIAAAPWGRIKARYR